MNVEIIRTPTDADWLSARQTMLHTRRLTTSQTPDRNERLRMLASEHSPIRTLVYEWVWTDMPYWISVHFVRHHVGIEHYVSSQRNDLQSTYDRRQAPQDAPVNHRCHANAQALVNISRARTCLTASNETRMAWGELTAELSAVSPEITAFMVPPCIYRGGICPEVYSACRYNTSKQALDWLVEYVEMYARLKVRK